MIGILHGYLLDGSGSNLWTQAIIRTLCRAGETVHLMCQEPHPEKFDYVAQAYSYDEQLNATTILDREVPYPGFCVLHKPTLGGILPVYVWDEYEEFAKVVPMIELDDASIEDYIKRNVALLDKLITQQNITAVLANHVVLMSVVAQQVAAKHALPYAIMPHGSAIEYAVKKDQRFHRYASVAITQADHVFVIGPEIRSRMHDVFNNIPHLAQKLVNLNLGVDTSLFQPISRAERANNIRKLGETLIGVERGKNSTQTKQMCDELNNDLSLPQLQHILKQAADYTAKYTDVDCERKLAAVDWEKGKILLFVGRLIANKGIHGVIAALPTILQQEPDAHLIVVGHGPLREALEALLWALATGNRALFYNIIRWGSSLEGAGKGVPLMHIEHYLTHLEHEGQIDEYFTTAQQLNISEKVIFTGYLTHHELRFLFPCCDVAIFPSMVAEAGPLVFLEALASGVFPMGINFAGMAASIDSLSDVLPPEIIDMMRLRQEPEHTVADIAHNSMAALSLSGKFAPDLCRVAVERYDWQAVGRKLLNTIVNSKDKPS